MKSIWWNVLIAVTSIARGALGEVERDVEIPVSDFGVPVASQALLTNQIFANSYGHPAVVAYEPPGIAFDHAVLTLNMSTFGRQYDRLVHVNLGSVELWRPSLPEPLGESVSATLTHDVSAFVSLLQQSNEFVFELDNIVEGSLNGVFNVSLVIDYYVAPQNVIEQENSWWYDVPANAIKPVIAPTVGYPDQNATGFVGALPRNTTRALLQVYASGNSNEEFWYSNYLTQGGGPSRLVQAFVNGQLAGVADPFPVIFSGGIDPGLWFPTNGLKADEVPAYFIDITPFLPLLWESSVSIDIAVGDGIDSTKPLSDWLISAALFTWQEPDIYGSGVLSPPQYTSDDGAANYTQSTFGAAYNHEVITTASLVFTNTTTNQTTSGVTQWTQSAVQRNAQVSTAEIWYMLAEGHGTSTYTWTPQGGAQVIYTRQHSYPMMVLQNSSSIAIDRHYVVSTNQPFNVLETQLATYNVSGSQSTTLSETSVHASFGPGVANYDRQTLSTDLELTNDFVSSSPFSGGTYSVGNPASTTPHVGPSTLDDLVTKLYTPATAQDFLEALPSIIGELGAESQINEPAVHRILLSLP